MHFLPRLPYAESFAYIFIIFFKHTDYLVIWRHYLKCSPLWYTMSLNVWIVSTCATCLYSMHWGLYRSHKKCDNTCEIYVTVMWWYKVYIPGVCGFISRWRICNINKKTASPKSLLASMYWWTRQRLILYLQLDRMDKKILIASFHAVKRKI